MKRIFTIKVIFSFLITVGISMSQEMWTPYEFKGTEHFKFEVKIKEGERVQEGFYILDFSKADGDKIKMHVKAKLDGNEFESTVTGEKNNVYSSIMGQMMFNPAAAPMFITLFAPWWSIYFVGHKWEVGSGWSMTEESGKKISFKIQSECEHAGVKGKTGVWRENDNVRAEFCISTGVALPLQVIYNDVEENKSYELTLVEYSE